MDGTSSSPNVSQGKEVEVEKSELKEMERPMKGWSQVRRKRGQVEKDVAAETRRWEEFYKFAKSYPYLEIRAVVQGGEGEDSGQVEAVGE